MSTARRVPAFLPRMLASGGDARIRVAAGATTNIYGASPWPRDMLGYAASTANDISQPAFRRLEEVIERLPWGAALSGEVYAASLERLRARIRSAYRLGEDIDIVFAPSGTDLEFVALHLARQRAGRPITNLLLGADEVGSGCLLSAQGRYFATETALCERIAKGAPLAGFEDVRVHDIPVRCDRDAARDSATVAADMSARIAAAHEDGRHVLAHVVHGSKTGLILPALAELDALACAHRDDVTFVVDACQARIGDDRLRAYLDRGAIVLMTGSKFMGGPPFSGFALVPPALAERAPPPIGLATVFRAAEWPQRWPGAVTLATGGNPGLLLRLEAAVYELERFHAVPGDARAKVIRAFDGAIAALVDRLGIRRVAGAARSPREGLLESGTLATLDISTLPGTPDLAKAQCWQRVLAARGIRVGQPVKCARLPDGRWAGTLRLSLSMPLISARANAGEDALARAFGHDMARVADILSAAATQRAA